MPISSKALESSFAAASLTLSAPAFLHILCMGAIANSKSAIIYYEDLVADADRELEKAWKLLGLKPIKGMNQYIKRPEFWSRNEPC